MINHKTLERFFLILFITVVVGIVFIKFQNSKAPFRGEGLIDIGGYSLFIKSEGSGTPAVVFETGLGKTLSYYNLISAEIQKKTRTVTYDRAGLGKSEKSPNNRTSEQKVIELHSLLEKARIKPPYILVASEFGSNNIRIFAAKYPEEVAGIILVDPRSENIRELLLVRLSEDEKVVYNEFLRLQYVRIPEYIKDQSYEEFLTNYEQVKTHWDSIKNIPVTTIISGTDNQEPEIKTIVESQRKIAAISNKSKVVEVSNPNPYMAYTETETIIKEIIEMLDKVKEK